MLAGAKSLREEPCKIFGKILFDSFVLACKNFEIKNLNQKLELNASDSNISMEMHYSFKAIDAPFNAMHG